MEDVLKDCTCARALREVKVPGKYIISLEVFVLEAHEAQNPFDAHSFLPGSPPKTDTAASVCALTNLKVSPY